MKKRKILQTAALSVLLASTITAGVSFAWFYTTANIGGNQGEANGLPIIGSSKSAYFAYGKGTSSQPYGIKTPRHLYNLAWLQYLGYFNDQQYYFELADNIDMTGWTLPPIGTEEYPFISNFNGQGYVVSNLTVSNKFGDYNVHPGVISEFDATNKQPHILGFFGVIGDYNGDTEDYSSDVNTFTDTGLSNVTVKTYVKDSLMGLAAGYVDATMSKVAVEKGTINIDKNITAATTSYGGFTTNISDYTVVGYSTPVRTTSLRKVTDTLYNADVRSGQEFNAVSQGTVDGWGGSLNMDGMYNRILNAQNASSTVNNFAYRTTTTYNANGSSTSANNTTTIYRYMPNNAVGNFVFTEKNTNYNYLGGGRRQVDNHYTYYTHEGQYITDGTNYLTWNGTALGNTTNQNDATLWEFTESTNNTYYVSTTYNDAKVYLRDNSGALTTRTSTNSDALWTYSINSSDSTKMNLTHSGYRIVYDGVWTLTNKNTVESYYTVSQTASGATHYISSASTSGNSPTDTTSASNAAHFYTDSTGFYFLNGTTKMYLALYRTSNWGRVSYSIRITNSANAGTNYSYFSYSGGNLTATRDGTTYRCRYNNGWTYNTGTTGNATVTSHSVDYSLLTLSNTIAQDLITKSGPDDYLSSTDSYMVYDNTNTTYFPLNVKADGCASSSLTNGNYLPTDANTGYVVSGSEVNDTGSTYASIIRVSRYDISKIDGSFSTSDTEIKDSKVYTINSSNQQVTIANDTTVYEKYTSSKQSLYTNALQDSDYVYGLHFLDSEISKNRLVNATNVSILGKNYNNYELPVDSIDFNLKDKGFINFFAGTYYNGSTYGRNNSFFSLHIIIRDPSTNKITAIKEIEEVYANPNKPTYSYAYKFTDGTYSKPFRYGANRVKYEMSTNDGGTVAYVENNDLTSTQFNTYTSTYNYQSVFNTSRIKNIRKNANGTYSVITTLTNDALYYFEIPMNDGEYCLGSVTGGVGGYLIYLDIGASASKTQRTSIAEHFINEIITHKYPIGVAIISTSTLDEDANPGFKNDNTICVAVMASYKGSIIVDRSNPNSVNKVTVTREADYTNVAKPSYISDTITSVVDPGNNDISGECLFNTKVTTETFVVQYHDYSVNYDQTMVTVITDVRTKTDTMSTTGAWSSLTRTIKQKVGTGAFVTLTNATQITNGTIRIYRYVGANNVNNGTAWTYNDITSTSSLIFSTGTTSVTSTSICGSLTTKILELYGLVTNGNISVSSTFEIEVEIDGDVATGTYYKIKDYIFIPTVTGGQVVYTVKSISTGKVFYFIDNGTQLVAVGDTATAGTAGGN